MKRPTTFARCLGSGVANAVLLTGLGLGVTLAPSEHTPPVPEALPAPLPADCWTGEAPADVTLPGSVILRYEGEATAKRRGKRAVSHALTTIFDGAEHGVAEVRAFCR